MSASPIKIDTIVNAIRPLLAGEPPEIQSAVLADLLAIWLAGHIVRGDPNETEKLRKRLLKFHLSLVRKLVPINAKQIHGGERAADDT